MNANDELSAMLLRLEVIMRAAENDEPEWCICRDEFKRAGRFDPHCRHDVIEQLLELTSAAIESVIQAHADEWRETVEQVVEQRDDAVQTLRAALRYESATHAFARAASKGADDAALQMLHDNAHVRGAAYYAQRESFQQKYPGVIVIPE